VIDLRVETILKENHELLGILEKLKAMDGDSGCGME
jgi:hypothetical protein